MLLFFQLWADITVSPAPWPLCYFLLFILIATLLKFLTLKYPQANSLWFFTFLQSLYTTWPFRNCQQFQQTFYCLSVATGAIRSSFDTGKEYHHIYNAEFRTWHLPISHSLELINWCKIMHSGQLSSVKNNLSSVTYHQCGWDHNPINQLS